MLNILVADDFPIVRQGVIQSLQEEGKVKTCDEAKTGQEVMEKVRANKYDVVLLDISMPGRGGIDVLKDIKSLRPDLPVLMLSMYPEDQYALRAMKAGASGYVNKTKDTSVLIEAINKVAAGRKYVTPELAEKLAFNLDKNTEAPMYKQLSDREFEVFRKIASGKTVSEIADELSLSVKTISTYRARILEKTDLKNNAEITRYAIEHNLVD